LLLAAGHDEDAATGGTAVGLDHEVVTSTKGVLEVTELGVGGDLGVDLWRGDAEVAAEPVQAELVIDEGELRARIGVEDSGGGAAVHAEDAQLAQAAEGGDDPVHARGSSGERETTSKRWKDHAGCVVYPEGGGCKKSRKRISSITRYPV